jgi:hypothetical protein
MCDIFPIYNGMKIGYALLSMLFKFASDYEIMKTK